MRRWLNRQKGEGVVKDVDVAFLWDSVIQVRGVRVFCFSCSQATTELLLANQNEKCRLNLFIIQVFVNGYEYDHK